MLEKLFTSKVRVKLLKLLVLNPDREFYIRELERELKENVNSIRRQLNNLEKIEIVKKRKEGNLLLYSFNPFGIISSELKQMILKTVGSFKLIKESLQSLKGIKFAFIFGSFAKGTETKRSDIDLLIVGNMDEDQLIEKLSKVERKIGREINYLLWSENFLKKKIKQKDAFLLEILKGPIKMLIGDEGEFRKLVKRKNNSKDNIK